MTTLRLLFITGGVALLMSCGERRTESPVTAPGQPAQPTTRVLEAGAAVLQDKPPIEALNAYLNGFHFYNGRPAQQMEAHHYCAILNEELIQCVIYDGNVKDAKLMGVEYIISGGLFSTLAADEKTLWHSHVHEVKSGQLLAPGIPVAAERRLMERLVGTYGKTWHTWHTDEGKSLPLGVPELMMGFTADGQANPAMVAARDKRFGIDSVDRRRNRQSIPAPAVDAGADSWQRGKSYQIPDGPGAETHSHDKHSHDRHVHGTEIHSTDIHGATSASSPSRPYRGNAESSRPESRDIHEPPRSPSTPR